MAHFGMVSLCSTDLGFLGSERVKPLSESQFIHIHPLPVTLSNPLPSLVAGTSKLVTSNLRRPSPVHLTESEGRREWQHGTPILHVVHKRFHRCFSVLQETGGAGDSPVPGRGALHDPRCRV